MDKPNTIKIDEVEYVRADAINSPAEKLNGLERCVIRSYAAGVFVGYVKEKSCEDNGVNITLLHAKRIYYWSGACSLTQLAMEGVKDPANCKITEPISSQYIANVIEILPMTEKASKNIDEVKTWKK
jgi:hypothetical protein